MDPDGENLTIAWNAELMSLNVWAVPEGDAEEQPRDRIEQRAVEAQQLTDNREEEIPALPRLDPRSGAVQGVLKALPLWYKKDKFFAKVWDNPSCYEKFKVHKELLWTINRVGQRVVCVPNGMLRGKSLRGVLIDTCHLTIGHLGSERMLGYVRQWFWWLTMGIDVYDFCRSCGKCQAVKVPRRRPPGWVHTMPIPARPWECRNYAVTHHNSIIEHLHNRYYVTASRLKV